MSQSRIFCMLARLCCGLLTLASVGCQTFPPYGYGGYSGNYNYPMYGQPGQVVPYSGPGVIQGGPIQGGPNVPLGPPGGYPNGGYPGNGFQGNYPGGGTAPPFGPTGSTTPPVPQVPRQSVENPGDSFGQPSGFPQQGRPSLPPDDPEYGDQNAGPSASNSKRPVQTPADIADPADLNGEIDGANRAKEQLKSMENKPIGSPKTGMLGSEVNDLQFTPPVSTKSGRSEIVQASQNVEAAQQANLRPYGNAKDGRWFRGKIDFDKQENTWYLIYNPEPELNDRLGGMVTLIEHPHLEHFTPDDVAQIEGAFDPSEIDASNNPKYRISVIRRLVEPK